jgi:hypothetical protein
MIKMHQTSQWNWENLFIINFEITNKYTTMCTSIKGGSGNAVLDPEAQYYVLHVLQYYICLMTNVPMGLVFC